MNTADAADVFQIASGLAPEVTAAIIALVAAPIGLTGVYLGARIAAKATGEGADTTARAMYTTALEQQNHAARRTAYIDFYDAGRAFVKDLQDFKRLTSRTVGPDDPADPFAEHRDRVSALVSAIRILGPQHIRSHADAVELRVTMLTYQIKRDHHVFYGWRNLEVDGIGAAHFAGVAPAARGALAATYNARSDRAREAARAVAVERLQAARVAGLITHAQCEALQADPTDTEDGRKRPFEKLTDPLSQTTELLKCLTLSGILFRGHGAGAGAVLNRAKPGEGDRLGLGCTQLAAATPQLARPPLVPDPELGRPPL